MKNCNGNTACFNTAQSVSVMANDTEGPWWGDTFFGVSSAQRLWCDFVSGWGPGRTNGIRERSPRQPGIRTDECVCVCVLDGVGTINALKADGAGRFMQGNREDGKGRKNKRRRWNGEKVERDGGGGGSMEGRVSGLTGRHRLCQHVNEGPCGRAHLVVGLHSKVASS